MKRSLCLLLTLLPGAFGADWPQFRGPTGQGHVEGSMPLRWGEDQNVTWKVQVPGEGWSSPVVADGRIYLTTAVPSGPDHSLRALCLDAQTGKVLWDQEVFRQEGDTAPNIHPKNSHASPTPVVEKDRLFVHFGHQGTACLDLAGKVLWRKRLEYRPVHGNGGSPVRVDDLLVFSCDGARERFVVALDAGTGAVRWKTERDVDVAKKFSFSTPLLLIVDGRRQIVSPGSNMVGGYDPKTGKELWRVRYKGYSVVPRPVFGQGLVFLSTGYDAPRLLAIRPTGEGDVTGTHLAWTLRPGAPLTPSPLLVGEELYLVSDGGIAQCVEARTGKVHWQKRIPGDYSTSPVHADGRVYFQSESGVTTVVAAGTEYRQLARNALDERTFASFAVVEGVLFLRGESHLYRIEEKAP